jgi:hypothetical protein
MRTCGTCGHWQPAHPTEQLHGECCVDVPAWACEVAGDGRRFVRATDPQATDCDCYVLKVNPGTRVPTRKDPR